MKRLPDPFLADEQRDLEARRRLSTEKKPQDDLNPAPTTLTRSELAWAITGGLLAGAALTMILTILDVVHP